MHKEYTLNIYPLAFPSGHLRVAHKWLFPDTQQRAFASPQVAPQSITGCDSSKSDVQKEKNTRKRKADSRGMEETEQKREKKRRTREKEQMRGGKAWEGKAGGESLGRRRGGGQEAWR